MDPEHERQRGAGMPRDDVLVGAQGLGDAEVRDDCVVAVEKYVLRLDVAVHDPVAVGGR
jgi:hypothetical protein